jgi:zinc transporter ZupT
LTGNPNGTTYAGNWGCIDKRCQGRIRNGGIGLALLLSTIAGLSTAVGSRHKAFVWSLLSGVAEPIGAGVAALALMPFLSSTVLDYVLATLAGVMVFISLDELVPVACSFSEEHLPLVGVAVGIVVLALSLWLLQ